MRQPQPSCSGHVVPQTRPRSLPSWTHFLPWCQPTSCLAIPSPGRGGLSPPSLSLPSVSCLPAGCSLPSATLPHSFWSAGNSTLAQALWTLNYSPVIPHTAIRSGLSAKEEQHPQTTKTREKKKHRRGCRNIFPPFLRWTKSPSGDFLSLPRRCWFQHRIVWPGRSPWKKPTEHPGFFGHTTFSAEQGLRGCHDTGWPTHVGFKEINLTKDFLTT